MEHLIGPESSRGEHLFVVHNDKLDQAIEGNILVGAGFAVAKMASTAALYILPRFVHYQPS
jgi:hypothetical protein